MVRRQFANLEPFEQLSPDFYSDAGKKKKGLAFHSNYGLSKSKSENKVKPNLPAALGKIRFLYIGSKDVERDLAYYRDVIGSEVLWHVKESDTSVAAVKAGEGPILLQADHQPVPSCEPIFEVDDLDQTAANLKKRGWRPEGGLFEIPNGPCYIFRDPSGNKFAVFQDTRPNVMKYIIGKNSAA